MKYQIIAKIVGPYLPNSYTVFDVVIAKENIDSPQVQFPTETSSIEKHIIGQSVEHRIRFSSKKPRFRKFSSPHVIRVNLEEDSPYEALELAKLRIEHLVESLTLASFNVDKIHPHTGQKMWRNISDIYQYQIIGIFNEDGTPVQEVDINDFTTGVNYFPKDFPDDLEGLTNDILGCNEETVIKLMSYLKRAKNFSFEYYSELEIFLNSMKCIELLANKFYPQGLRKQDGSNVNFKNRMEGFDTSLGIVEILGVDQEYKDIAIKGWNARNNLDMAHASEYLNLIAHPFPEDVNKVAYYFTLKYILYLKVHNPGVFWGIEKLDSDWWQMFR